jgi:outer membrane receptor protein involved in Fe transport
MRMVLRLVCLMSVCWIALGHQAAAQTETGKITGRITDEQGAVLPGVTVTATAVDTQVVRTTTTDGNGVYVFASVQPATYEIKGELSGFRTIATRTTVAVGSSVTVDAKMTVGGLAEVVQVTAQEPTINTRTQEISTTVTQTQLRELPTITRNPYDLVSLAGTASDQDQTTHGAMGVSLNGLRSASTNVLLDGAANNDEFAGSVGQQVPLDAVQEFSVISNNFSAQYGRASGGIVNVVVKSGTNALHGSGYEFFRNDSLATNTFDNKARDIEKSPFDRNQYGGSAGGPIKRDKAFFFASAEYIRVRSNATDVKWVPTPQFLAQTSPATQAFFNAYKLSTPINGPVITRGEITGANATGAFASLPAGLPIFGQVQQSLPSDAGGGDPQNTLLTVGRVDLALNPSTTFYARYALEHQDVFAGTNSNSPWAGFNTGTKNVNNNILASLTNVWSPRFTTQSKFVFNRLNSTQPLGDAPVGPTLYMRSSVTSLNNINIALPGYLPYNPGSSIPFGGPQNFVQLYEDSTFVKGSHDIRFGGTYTYFVDDRTFGAYETSVLTLGTTIGNALDNLVLGQLRQFQSAVDPQGHFPGQTVSLPLSPPSFERSNRYNEWAVYVTDAWRPSSRVTLNLGLRYEYFGVQHNKDPKLDSNFYLGSGANIFEQIRNGSVQIAPDSPVGGLWAPDRNNFAPRLGFAWDVTGDGRTSIRGGYSIGYERNFNNVTFNVIQNPPNYAVVSLVAGTDVPVIPLSTDNAGPLAGTGAVTLPRTSLRFVNPHIQTAYAHLWSLSFQRELFRGLTASIDYSGSAGEKLYSLEDPNAPGSAAAYLGDLSGGPLGRLDPQYSNMNQRNNNGLSRYHALIFGVDSRGLGNTGLSFTARYTYGRTKDNLSTTFSESNNNFNLGLLDPFNPRLDYGYADYDIRHRLTAGVIWELPFARNSNALLHALAGGWQVAGVVKAQSGSPFTIYDCTNGNARCIRLLVEPGLTRTGASNPASTGDPNSFMYLDLTNQASGVGTYANALTGTSDFGPFPANMDARNGFRRPGIWNVDAIFSKRFAVAGTRGLQVRIEAYNLFNHANLFIRQDAVDMSSSTQVLAFRGDTGTGDGAPQGDGQRRLQLGLRFDF